MAAPEVSNKRKAEVLVGGDNNEIELTTLLIDFIKRSDERAEQMKKSIERMEDRVERNWEELVALTKKVENESIDQNSFEKSLEQIAKADEEENLSSDEESVVNESDTWSIRFQELREYRMMNDDCKVPQNFKENPKLGIWVKEQRKRYNNVQTGKGNKRIAPERIAKLDRIGFNWGKKYPPPPSWDEMFEQLHKFWQKKGHCKVPFNEKNPSAIAKWMACQRTEYKRFRKGRDSLLTNDQIGQLKEIGFDWKGAKL